MESHYPHQYMEDNQAFNFKDTKATKKVFELKKRIRAVAGGTSASKTISILVWLIDYCQTKQKKDKMVHVVAESFPHLQLGAMEDFKNIMKDRGYWNDDRWHGTNYTYTFETGNRLRFLSVDTYGKAHGPRRDVLFVNEANNLEYRIVDQLITRTREVVWMDWNPSSEFWFYSEILPNRDDVDFITLTYLDNDALDDISVREIESHKNNKSWWNVYGLGQLGIIEGRIYKDWKIIDEIPHEARLERRGMDFGYSVDPTVLVDIYYYNGGFIIDEQIYQKGLSNKAIFDFIHNLPNPQTLIVADSAEPKSIEELKDYGLNIIGATKGPGSVYQGIQFVQDQKISVTRRSVRTIKAHQNYLFFVDKDGITKNWPDDRNHEWSNPMDAIRYGLTSFKKPEEDGAYEKAASEFINPVKPFPFLKADEYNEQQRELKEQIEYERAVAQMNDW